MIAFLSALALASAAASPRTDCTRYVRPLALGARRAEAADIALLSKASMTARDVHLVMASGAWRLVWAIPIDNEEGIWFLRRTPQGERLVDTWGGSFSDDADRANGVAWATEKGVPLLLARCFAAIGIDHEMMR